MSGPLSSKPFATAYDKYGDASGNLVGNPEGLRRLRDLIDEALAKGEVSVVKEEGFDFCAIKVQLVHPEEKKREETTTQKILKVGCFIALVVLGILLVAGVIKVVEWI